MAHSCTLQGSFGMGLLAQSKTIEPYGAGVVEGSMGIEFCNISPAQLKLKLADFNGILAINADGPLSNYVPFTNYNFVTASLGKNNWTIRFLSQDLLRNPKFLDASLAISVLLGGVGLKKETSNLFINAYLDILGLKSLSRQTDSVPFLGLDLAKLYFKIAALSRFPTVQFENGFQAIFNASIGQSGDNRPDKSGSFNSWLLEPTATIYSKIIVPLSDNSAWYTKIQLNSTMIYDSGANSTGVVILAWITMGLQRQ